MADPPVTGPWLTRRAVLPAGTATAFALAVTSPASAAPPAEPERTPPAPPPETRPRIDIVCGECGGNDVSRDAWASRDIDAQDWELGAVFDYGHCHDCDGEGRLVEVELVSWIRSSLAHADCSSVGAL